VNETAEKLKRRTMVFAIQVTRFCRTLPEHWEGRHVGDQLLRSVTSVAANYGATCRSRSRREFIAKLGLVVEEADETLFWLLFVAEAGLKRKEDVADLVTEARELLAIFTASAKTASTNLAARTP